MARTDVLDRQTTEEGLTEEEIKHKQNAKNYLQLLYSDVPEEELLLDEPQAPKATVGIPATNENTIRRIADYKPYTANRARRNVYTPTAYGNVYTAPSATVVAAPAPVSAPASEEDALPTQRTLDTLRHAAADVETNEVAVQKTGFLSAVSTKAKVVLAAVVTFIVLALAVIFINTGIINSLDANIADLQVKVSAQNEAYAELVEQIEDAEDFIGPIAEMAKQLAEELGMTLG